VNGDAPTLPRFDRNGRLWLTERDVAREEGQQDRLGLQVYRHVDDAIPLRLTTRLRVEVSGQPREILLGPVLHDGFEPLAIRSPLPARLEPDGRLRIQVRPGTWDVDFLSRSLQPVNALGRPVAPPPWPDEEIWVFQARTDLRLVELHGLTPVDPRQTGLPKEWQALPAFRFTGSDSLTIEEIRRGDPEPEPNQLALSRQLWLDFEGGGYSARDRISGTMTSGWRISAGDTLVLGSAQLNGEPQFITERDGRPGVEVRRGQLELIADSRLEGNIGSPAAVSWDHDFQSLSATLNLPPGWALLAATGPDAVSDTWFKRWTLLDLFLVLIVAIAVTRLWGWRWGMLALVSLVLSWQEPGAPRQVWLHLLASMALLNVLPAGRLRRLIGWYRNGALLVLAVILVPFMIDEVRTSLFPQLERPWQVQPELARAPVPAAPPGIAGGRMPEPALMEDLAVESEITVDELRQARPAESASSLPKVIGYSKREAPKDRLQMVDPDANVQTGPGIPDWRWTTINLSWNGPVDRDQTLHLRLISPPLNLLLAAVRVVLLVALAAFFVGLARGRIPLRSAAASLAVTAVLLPGLFNPGDALAQAFPDPVLLEALEQRLLEAPECVPRCAEIPRLRVSAGYNAITLELDVVVAEAVAVPLPIDPAQWLPEAISIDDAVAGAIERRQGSLWAQLDPGAHTLRASGPVPAGARVRLPLLLPPGRVESELSGWRLEGLRDNGTATGQLVLIRLEQAARAPTQTLEPSQLPVFARVERSLRLGLDWRVDTRVTRESHDAAAVVLSVPLLDGESVTSAGIQVEDDRVKVNLTPGQRELRWSSVLDKRDRIVLAAPDTRDWVEIWRLDVGPIWHVESDGLAVVHHQDRSGQWLPEWRPWPGEQVALDLSRPAGVSGNTLTVDAAQLTLTPGRRASDAVLGVTLRSSQGGQHTVTLPEDAELLAVTIDGAAQPIRQQGREVTLPVRPGTQQVAVEWRSAMGIRSRFTTPPVDLASDSVNVRLGIKLGRDRWTLFTGGPDLGPAVLFWAVLIVIGAVAIGLARSPLTPLGVASWVLLGIGLSQVNIWLAVIVVAWLLAFGWRAKHGAALDTTAFNFTQIGLGVLTLGALLILFHAVQQGLLGLPDMQVTGNGSNAYQLNWYQDRSAAELPQAWVLSVPIIVYRLAMLAWALWLAFALLSWLRWAWRAYNEGGLWQRFSWRQRGEEG
jgi:hypothetical protein